MWFKSLFSRRKELLILSIALIVVAFLSHGIAINHWQELNWEVTGFHPLAPLFVMLWASITMTILYLRRIRSPGLWGMAMIALAYGLIMAWMLWLR